MNPTYVKVKGRWDEREKELDEQHGKPRFTESTRGNRTCRDCGKEIKEGEKSIAEKRTGKHSCPECMDAWFDSLDPGT